MENWKDIEGYEGLYQVSTHGRVRSLGNGKSNNSKVRVLVARNTGCGYFQVMLYKNGKGKNLLIHRLVAEAFIPNLFNYEEVNHIDEDKTNNNVENLEWCDRKYNINYGSCIDRRSEKNTNGKKSKSVFQFTKSGELVNEWSSTHEAGRNGFDQSAVSACCNGKNKSHHGFIWRYKDI